MRWARKFEWSSVAAGDDEYPFASLRHAVVGGIDDVPDGNIVSLRIFIDAADAVDNAVEAFTLASVGKTVNIL
jgi:hypothetical protein